jgi:hypothetical protein
MVDVGAELAEVNVLCLKMVESALSHPHAFAKPTEVRNIIFSRLYYEKDQIVTVHTIGNVRDADNTGFRCKCVLTKTADGFAPRSVELHQIPGNIGPVIGESRVDTDENGIRLYVTRT